MKSRPGASPSKTTAPPLERLHDVVEALKRAIAGGAQIYWVCPLIESSEVSELAAAEERWAHLKQFFGDAVGLMHGAMAGSEKDKVMAEFTANRLQILVSTTVIEVGVNVPNASVMVIEHAERFGLAQLHQLRGRVGRGERQSYCMLLHKAPLGETAAARLKMMCDTEDGFVIAEKDLELRGGRRSDGRSSVWRAGISRGRCAQFRGASRRCPRRCDHDSRSRSQSEVRARRSIADAALSVRM